MIAELEEMGFTKQQADGALSYTNRNLVRFKIL